MRKASIPTNRQAEYSWRGSYQRASQNGQMPERSAVGRLLNATIVVCGACYILYIAVYLGLDLKSIVARPLRDTANVRLRLHSNPAPWDGEKQLQLHSVGQAGAPDAYADAEGINRLSDFGKTIEEPVPGVGMLADETRAETGKQGTDDRKASAGSSLSDMSENAAAAGQLAKDATSSLTTDELPAADAWAEDKDSSKDKLEPKSPFKDVVGGSDSLPERAEGKELVAKVDSFLHGVEESILKPDDEDLSTIGNTGQAVTSVEGEKAAAKEQESQKELFLLDMELDADRNSAGSPAKAAKSSASKTAAAGDDDLEMLKAEDDPFLTDSGSDSLRADKEASSIVRSASSSRADGPESKSAAAAALGSEDDSTAEDEDLEMLEAEADPPLRDSLVSGKGERESDVTQADSFAEADAADEEIQEPGYTISTDDDDEDWDYDELLEEDLLLRRDDAGEEITR